MNLITKLLNKKIGKYYKVKDIARKSLVNILLFGPICASIGGVAAFGFSSLKETLAMNEFKKTEYYNNQTAEDYETLKMLEHKLYEEKVCYELATQQFEKGELTSSEYAVIYENYNSAKNNYYEIYEKCTSSSRPKTIIQKYIDSIEAGEIVKTSESTEQIVAEYKHAKNGANIAQAITFASIGIVAPSILLSSKVEDTKLEDTVYSN